MVEEPNGNEGRPRRQPRPKRAPRKDQRAKIVIALTPEEKSDLMLKAHDTGISSYVRARLFGTTTRAQPVMRAIAELHVAGRLLDAAMRQPDAGVLTIAPQLNRVRRAIDGLAVHLPGLDANDEPGS